MEVEAESPIIPSATPRLFTLPAEIRCHIYGFCIPQKCVIEVTNAKYRPWGVQPVVSTRDSLLVKDKFLNTKPLWTNILHVCKQMSEECLGILYGANLFEVYLNRGGESMLKKTFSHRNLQRIRFLVAVFPGRWFSGELNPPDVAFWATIIPNLKLFEWVTQPDTKSKRHLYDIVPQKQFEIWLEWTDSYMDCFGELMASGMQFKLKFDNEKGKYRKIGNLVFWRGPFFKKGG
ncbi:hypothetical protein N7475_005330 [Penicillium sp. IBT 31633x]|nr:hypothetical protein N7475_005330 [Penicillium sp. IBT 31633x]